MLLIGLKAAERQRAELEQLRARIDQLPQAEKGIEQKPLTSCLARLCPVRLTGELIQIHLITDL